jgi:predicted  nucleic acid-binding Zn-ribbon protein
MTNQRIDEKASAQAFHEHVRDVEKSDIAYKEAIKELREKHERTIVELNARHEQNVRDLRQEINGLSDRIDKRFDVLTEMIRKSWNRE